jgi:hypothetical protein
LALFTKKLIKSGAWYFKYIVQMKWPLHNAYVAVKPQLYVMRDDDDDELEVDALITLCLRNT